MNLLMVGWASSEQQAGGVESIQKDMVDRLGARFVDVREAARELGVEVGRYQRHANIDRACMLAEYVERLEENQSFDAVIAAADAGAMLHTKAPLVLYWHNPYRDIADHLHRQGSYDRSKWYEYAKQYPALEEHGGRRAFANVAVSSWMRGYLGRCRTRADSVIPLGIDPEVFSPGSPGERGRIRLSLGLPPNQPVVLFSGAFHPVSGFATVHRLAAQHPEWSFLYVFKERKPQDPLLLGTADVRFPESGPNCCVLDCLPRSAMAAVYRAADVMVSASPIESFNLKAIEALASGTPVVTTRAGVFADWPESGPFGVVCGTGDVEDMAAGIERVLAGEAGTNPRSAVVPYFTLDRFERDWRALLGRVVDRDHREVRPRALHLRSLVAARTIGGHAQVHRTPK